jgi:hypothetical protein
VVVGRRRVLRCSAVAERGGSGQWQWQRQSSASGLVARTVVLWRCAGTKGFGIGCSATDGGERRVCTTRFCEWRGGKCGFEMSILARTRLVGPATDGYKGWKRVLVCRGRC